MVSHCNTLTTLRQNNQAIMTSMKPEIRQYLLANLARECDPWLREVGFSRRKNALVYARTLAEAVQKVEVVIEIHPKDRPGYAAAVYPWLEVKIDTVERVVLDMAGNDVSVLFGQAGTTLREPIAFTSAKAMPARWFIYQRDSVSDVIVDMKSFLHKWTLPFLNLYSTPAGVCEAYDRGDARVLNDNSQKLRVAAAMIVCGRTADALGVVNRWFGKPGLHKRYQRVFDYLSTEKRYGDAPPGRSTTA